jgi:PAS domain S-box-containing protein
VPDAAPDNLRLVAEHAPAMLWRARPGAGRDYLNPAWLAFTGRTLAEEIGDGWMDAVHPDDREACQARFGAALAASAGVAMEYRLRRHDGSFRLVRDEGRPCEDGSIVGACLDLGEPRPQEERLRAALADAHHRTRNNLQVMLSLIGLYRRAYPDSQGALETLAGRIRAMDAVQHQLQDIAHTVDARDYLQRLASALAHAAGPGQPGVVVRGETFALSAKEANSLGMIVAEASAPDAGTGVGAVTSVLVVEIGGGPERHVALLGPGVRDDRPGPTRRLMEAYAAKGGCALSGDSAATPPRLVVTFGHDHAP